MKPFVILQTPATPVRNCPRGEVCGFTWQPMLAGVPLSELPRVNKARHDLKGQMR